MKKYITLLAIGLMTMAFTGCDVDDNVVSGFLYEEVGGNYVVTDSFGNELTFTLDQAAQIREMDKPDVRSFLEARFRSTFPESYSAGEEVVVTSEVDDPPDVLVSRTAQTVVNSLGYMPVWGDLASLVANGILGIGAVWLGRRKRTADKVNESLVRGIDTFRDVLDQTSQGEKIDAELTKILRDYQQELRTADEVIALLKRFGTPTKRPIEL
jgi:hypothetical protein